MGIFKRKQDTSWVYKYELEDFVCKEISIQQYDGINGTWGICTGKISTH